MNEFLNPEKILNEIEIKSDMVAADFGCGSGGFSIPLAKKLENGLVYAIDIQEQPLSFLKSCALVEKITNIKFIRSDLEKPRGSTLKDASIDLVLISNILFQTEEKNAIIEEAKRIIKDNGKIIIIEWSSSISQGPEEKISKETIKQLAEKNGLKMEKEFEAGKYHYGLIFKK